ncbi:MAG: SRPBCC domain-containing protein [Phycisphaerae bacterium]|nr:SRPBCC domain-containing protein [Phycisphaerae bacterium]
MTRIVRSGGLAAIGLMVGLMSAALRADGPAGASKREPGTGRTIETEVVVPAPVAEVWDAFSTRAGVESWMVPVAELDFRVGGTIKTNYNPEAKIGDPGTIIQHILAYEPERMFAMRFTAPETAPFAKIAESTWTVTRFEPIDASHTRVVETMYGFGEGEKWDVAYAHFKKGNAWSLEQLVKRFTPRPPAERTLDHQIVVDAPVADVWDAWTTTRGIRRWLAPNAEIDLRVGGAIRFPRRARPGEEAPTTAALEILAYEPQRMLAYRTSAPPQFPTVRNSDKTWAVIRFDPISERQTRVHVSALGWQEGEEWDAAYEFFRKGNAMVLEELRKYFADPTGAGETLRWEAELSAPLADVWAVFTTKEGLQSWVAPQVEVDLRIGGTIRSNYNATARPDDAGWITQHILAYEPMRMLAAKVSAPANAPQAKIAEQSWGVVRLDPIDERRTRVTLSSCGWGTGAEWDAAREFFDKGNRGTLDRLRRMFAKGDADAAPDASAEADAAATTSAAERSGDALAVMSTLIGGEWITEVAGKEGRKHLIKNVYEYGPDGRSIYARNYQGDERGLVYAEGTLIWRDPSTGRTRFTSVDQRGGLSTGEARRVASDRVEWDWIVSSASGRTTRYHIETIFEGADRFRMVMAVRKAGAEATSSQDAAAGMVFRRVADPPEAYRRIRASVGSKASLEGMTEETTRLPLGKGRSRAASGRLRIGQ